VSVRWSFLSRRKGLVPLAILCLAGLWLWLYRGIFPYLAIIFSRQEFRTNQIVLAGVIILILAQAHKGVIRPRLDALPQLHWPALALALGSSALYLLIERYLDINTFSASLFGLASYGLLGLWMRPRSWRQGLPAALLLVGALPFGEHLQTFVGYPVRVLTAEIVRDGLVGLGVQTVGVDTILVFESGISKVDLPCSGVKSLWTGAMFLLAATWIERRPINHRWLAAGLVFAVLLLGANLGRVAVLVAVGQVAGWHLLAEMLHVPLGVLGFVGACAAAVVMLRWAVGAQDAVDPGQRDTSTSLKRPVWLMPLLATIVLVMALLYTPRPATALAGPAPEWHFPPEIVTESWPLSPGEMEWLSQAGILSADRWRFQWQMPPDSETSTPRLSGSMLFVSSATWRAHHRPEYCLEIYGLSTNRSFTNLVAPDFPVRLLVLDIGRQKEVMSAAYWLQSPDQTTDDFATRVWADLAPQRQRWVLVTILFDQAIDLQSAQAKALYRSLRASVQRNLEGGLQP
jgi:exosortase O